MEQYIKWLTERQRAVWSPDTLVSFLIEEKIAVSFFLFQELPPCLLPWQASLGGQMAAHLRLNHKRSFVSARG